MVVCGVVVWHGPIAEAAELLKAIKPLFNAFPPPAPTPTPTTSARKPAASARTAAQLYC